MVAVIGLGEAYSLGPEFAAALAVTAITLTRDPTAGTWPIGQSYPPELLDGQLSNPEGISNSHNEYESDASPGRVGPLSIFSEEVINNVVERRLFE
jgi:hypothetical protein